MTAHEGVDDNASGRRIGWDSLQPRSTRRRPPVEGEEHWFEIPGSLLHEDGVIRLREPATSDVSQILEALRAGTYAKPFVIDDGLTRRLHFDFRSVQSEMRLAEPDELTFAYTRKMMAFLLFRSNPKHIVIVGLGGGSLTKFCYRQLPRARITTIEVDEAVIGLSEVFQIPAPDRRLRLLHADAADYFETAGELADIVLIDGCDRWGTAATFCTPEFHQNLRKRLRPRGMLVLNLIGLQNRIDALLQIVDKTFGGRHAVVNVPVGGNRILFVFNEPEEDVNWSRITQQARRLQSLHGLDFPAFARRLRRRFQP